MLFNEAWISINDIMFRNFTEITCDKTSGTHDDSPTWINVLVAMRWTEFWLVMFQECVLCHKAQMCTGGFRAAG